VKMLTPIKAIRAKCLDCMCQQPKEVKLCRTVTCALWPYRMGRRPAASEGTTRETQKKVTVGTAT